MGTGSFRRPRVLRIFTGNSISLSMYWRQWGSRYAILAGRNLPDKEFRYLRTVIVTAAVYRGFNSELAPLLLTFRQIGRAHVCTPVTNAHFVCRLLLEQKTLIKLTQSRTTSVP